MPSDSLTFISLVQLLSTILIDYKTLHRAAAAQGDIFQLHVHLTDCVNKCSGQGRDPERLCRAMGRRRSGHRKADRRRLSGRKPSLLLIPFSQE